MQSKNHCLLILGLLFSSFSYTNQIKMDRTQESVDREKKVDVVDEYAIDDEFIDFNLDEDVQNVAGLVPLWARLANKLVAPLFVLYNKMSGWWQGGLKKNANIKRF